MRDSRASQGFLIVNIMALQLHLLTMFFPEKYVTLPYDLAEQIGTCPNYLDYLIFDTWYAPTTLVNL